jgi:hypothetical protein
VGAALVFGWSHPHRFHRGLTQSAAFDFAGKWFEFTTGKSPQYPNLSRNGNHIYFEDIGESGPELDRVSV